MSLWEEHHRGQMSSSLHHIKSTYCQHELSLLMLKLITWVEIEFVRFLHCKVTNFSSFPYCSLWKMVIMCNLSLKSGEFYSTSWRVDYLHKYFENFLPRFVYFSPFTYSSWIFILYFGLRSNIIVCVYVHV